MWRQLPYAAPVKDEVSEMTSTPCDIILWQRRCHPLSGCPGKEGTDHLGRIRIDCSGKKELQASPGRLGSSRLRARFALAEAVGR